jgi:predicted alpha/beta-hydrolase family hydrolase
VFAALAKGDAAATDVEIPTARGVALKAVVHRPAKGNGAAVVLAPGQGYSMEKPLLKRSAEALAEAGFVAVRFDWAYWTAKGEASADLATEVADADAAVAFAKKQDGVSKVLLAGKSLGSFVALRWSNEHPDALAGLALLTFPTNDPQNGGAVRQEATALEKCALGPLIVCGDADPMADLPTLYGVAAKAKPAARVVIVPGDHGFGDGVKGSPVTLENVDLAVQNLVLWAKRRLAAK